MDNLQDWLDGTDRWDRKGVPHERRWWRQKAHELPSATFRSWFRCRQPTFQTLVLALYGTTYMFRPNNTGPYIDPCERVAVFLFRVGGGHGVRGTAAHYDISEGSVVDWTLKVAKLVVKRLQPQYVRLPRRPSVPAAQLQVHRGAAAHHRLAPGRKTAAHPDRPGQRARRGEAYSKGARGGGRHARVHREAHGGDVKSVILRAFGR
ncbi:unnamed protein product [Ectocarpus fasciculatus]